MYKKLNIKIAPYVQENVPEKITKEISQLPSVTDITNFIKVTWNKGVMSSMEFISNLPTHTFNSATSLYETTQSYIKELRLDKKLTDFGIITNHRPSSPRRVTSRKEGKRNFIHVSLKHAANNIIIRASKFQLSSRRSRAIRRDEI